MNSYKLSRNWFEFSFNNPDKIKPIHTAIYFFALEHCNRLGWKDKFGFPSQMAMDAIGVKHWKTYTTAFNDLIDWGFIELIQRSKNQYSSNIISIAQDTYPLTKTLDSALIQHSNKHKSAYTKNVEAPAEANKVLIQKTAKQPSKQRRSNRQSNRQSTVSINKQETKNNKQETNNNNVDSLESTNSQPSLIGYFGEKYKQCYGVEYHANFGKDGKLLKSIKDHYGYDEVLAGIDYFFDQYIKYEKFAGANPTVGIFYAKWNAMVATGRGNKKEVDELMEWANG